MIEITSGVIYRAEKGDSIFSYASCKTVINLQTSFWEILFNTDVNQELRYSLVREARYVDFALNGLVPPACSDVVYIMNELEFCPKPVVFHCRRNSERTGYIAAVYKITRCGWSFERAYADWRASGCNWITWKLWKPALRKWA